MAASIGQIGSSKSRRKHRRDRVVAEINVTPFVDVMLVLLIVFMITAPLLTTGVQINLPQSQAPAIGDQDEPVSVSIRDNGEIYIQETLTTLDGLSEQLAAIASANPELRVFVRGDRNVDYGTIMGAVSAIKGAGLGNIALVTEAGGQ